MPAPGHACEREQKRPLVAEFYSTLTPEVILWRFSIIIIRRRYRFTSEFADRDLGRLARTTRRARLAAHDINAAAVSHVLDVRLALGLARRTIALVVPVLMARPQVDAAVARLPADLPTRRALLRWAATNAAAAAAARAIAATPSPPSRFRRSSTGLVIVVVVGCRGGEVAGDRWRLGKWREVHCVKHVRERELRRVTKGDC
jgi:hypothetical protein